MVQHSLFNLTKMKKLIIITLLTNIFYGCSEDALTTTPKGNQFASIFFKTEAEVESALFATYDVLGHQKGINLAWSPYLTLSEVLSDDAFAGGQDEGDGALANEFNTFNISTGSDVVRSIWKRNYYGIYRANFTIVKALELIDTSDEFTDIIVAEAKFLRAYYYFEQVRFFENIPLVTRILSLSEGGIGQADPEEIYNQIATDLVDAIGDLPEAHSEGKGRATKWAAQALLARVYLFEDGVYGNGMVTDDNVIIDAALVLGHLEDLIMNSDHDLVQVDYASIFTSSEEFGIESVFEISYAGTPVLGDWGSEQGVEGNLAAQQMGPRIQNSSIYYRGWAFGIPSHKLFTAMVGDPRRDVAIITLNDLLAESGVDLKDINTASYQFTGYYNGKYTTRLVDQGTLGTPELHNMTNYRAIRYADVLLMAAEIGQNATYLNEVRNRVGLGSIAYSEAALFHERRMELAGEGHRYWDLLRQGQSIAQQELTMSGTGPEYTGNASVYEVIFNSTTKGFLPIPQVEIDLVNGAISQNDGY